MVIRLRDRLLPLIKLSDVIADGRPIRNAAKKELAGKADGGVVNIAVVSAGDVHYGLIVDTLLDSSEIVVKPLGRHLKKCKAYAGATILGDGRVALILDVGGICRDMKLFNIGDSEAQAREEEPASTGAESDNLDERDRQSLLIVHNGKRVPFAVRGPRR
jgi:two-component system chemotaxis sensor kinase CheA